MLAVGNDIIDLKKSYALNKSRDTRFLQRILSPNEIKQIQAADNPEWLLWLFWAAKETMYKLVSQLESHPPVFSHKIFHVEFSNSNLSATFKKYHFPLHYETTDEYIHVFAGHPNNENIVYQVKEIRPGDRGIYKNILRNKFTVQELESIKHIASALVRYELKNYLVTTLRVQEETIEIIRDIKDGKTRAPYLKINGEKINIKIGFSHHEKFYSWICENLK